MDSAVIHYCKVVVIGLEIGKPRDDKSDGWAVLTGISSRPS